MVQSESPTPQPQVPDVRMYRALTGTPTDEEVSPEDLDMAVQMGWIGTIDEPAVKSWLDYAPFLIPGDGSWLIVQMELGILMCAETATIVPRPPQELYHRLVDKDDAGAAARFAYAEEVGLPLLLPGAPGRPLDQLTQQEGYAFWVIDPNLSSAVHQLGGLILVQLPHEALEDVEDVDIVSRYAIERGVVPVAPPELFKK